MTFEKALEEMKEKALKLIPKECGILIAVKKECGIPYRKKMTKKILDVCCGSKMFWFQKNRDDTVYMDHRELEDVLCDGRKLEIKPNIIGDFRNIPFPDETFKLVVFDPPHLIKVGEKSWLAKKYGQLGNNWKEDIKQGFKECFRVLENYGVLIFKWNEEQIKLNEILKLTDVKPLFGNKRAKTHWLVFIKEEQL